MILKSVFVFRPRPVIFILFLTITNLQSPINDDLLRSRLNSKAFAMLKNEELANA